MSTSSKNSITASCSATTSITNTKKLATTSTNSTNKSTAPILFKLIRKSKWNEVLQRLEHQQPLLTQEELSYKNSGGNTVLHYACYRNPPFIIIQKLLYHNPMLIYQRNSNNSTPLHIASIYGISEQVMELLIEYGEKIQHLELTTNNLLELKNMEGATPLHNACWKKTQTHTIKTLIKHNPTITSWTEIHGLTPLHVLLWTKPSLSQIQLLVDSYRYHEHPNNAILTSTNDEYATPLHFAVKYSPRIDIITLLLSAGNGIGIQAITLKNRYNATPLHILLTSSSNRSCCGETVKTEEICKLFIESSPAVAKIQDCTGATPLHLSCCYSLSEEILKLLIYAYPQAKAMQDKSGNTPLHLFLSTYSNNESSSSTFNKKANMLDMVMLLYSKECLKLQDDHGNTPLLHACSTTSTCSEQIIYFLYHMYPESIMIADINDRTPLHLLFMKSPAPEGGISGELILKMITNHEDILTRQDCLGNTPLHCAIQNNASYKILQILIQSNPTPIFQIQNLNGFTPYELFWKQYLPILSQYYDPDVDDIHDGSDNILLGMVDRIPCHFWKKIHLLLSHTSNPAHRHHYPSQSITVKCSKMNTEIPILHAACAVPTPGIFIQFLLQLYPHLATQIDDLGRVPLHYATMTTSYHQNNDNNQEHFTGPYHYNQPEEDDDNDIILQHRAANDSFDGNNIDQYYHHTDEEENMRIRIAARTAATNALLSIASSDITSFDYDDNNGDDYNYTITTTTETEDSIIQHRAINTTTNFSSYSTTTRNTNTYTTTNNPVTSYKSSNNSSLSVIDILLQANKQTSSIKDYQGRLPLHLGCCNKLSWENDGLWNLFLTYPKAIEMKDDIMHMYPFMLAATNVSEKEEESCADDDCSGSDENNLNLIYQLLLNAPTLVL